MLFELELDHETLIVTPIHDLGEFGMSGFDEEAPALLRFWNESAARNVIVDFHGTDYFGSPREVEHEKYRSDDACSHHAKSTGVRDCRAEGARSSGHDL
ncbi:MAG: hypothetical protein Q8K78_07220 [Planctomycetaceae bacterium]|nr:hypothetical protein [Planctomycetaceae bacterium]